MLSCMHSLEDFIDLWTFLIFHSPNLIDIFFSLKGRVYYCEQGANNHYTNTNRAIWWTCWWAYC